MVSVTPAPTSTATAQVLVLGGGAVVRELFAPALVSLGLGGRTTVVEPDPAAQTVGALGNVVHADFRTVLSSSEVARYTHCIVALPNALHYEAVRGALSAGLHVLCEKPLSLSRVECEALAGLADAHGRVLAVNMVRRLFHSVQQARTLLRLGTIGAIRQVTISHGGAYGWPVASVAPFQPKNGGVLADMGIHYLDMAEMLFGALRPAAYVDDWCGGVESDCTYSLETPDGVPLTLGLSRLRRLANTIAIEGERGRITIDVDVMDRCALEAAAEPGAAAILTVTQPGGAWTFADYFAEQVRRFLQASPPAGADLVDGRMAARAVDLVEWAYRSRGRHQPTRSAGVCLEPGGVFVTGATGFIGTHLVERLAADGSGDIRAGYHSLTGCAAISRYPVEFCGADLRDRDAVRDAVRGRRHVFHLAYGRDDESARAITVDGTKNVVNAAIEEGVESVVVLSTMYVFGDPGGTVDESSPYRPLGGAYGTTKAEMERWCLERARQSPATRIVVLIPSCVYGPGGRTYSEWPVVFAREGRFCWIADGAGIANVVYVENLVDAMLRAASTPAAHGQRFIINDRSVTWREFLSPLLAPWRDAIPSPTAEEFARLSAPPARPTLREIARAVLRSPDVWTTLGRTKTAAVLRPFIKRHVPAVVRLRRTAAIATDTSGSVPPPQPPDWLADVYGPTATRVSSARAATTLGWTPRVDAAEALARTVAWLRHQGVYPDAAE
jgi:nucleoside-diphosphate-sugar epimerase/predicted dehydrogenase